MPTPDMERDRSIPTPQPPPAETNDVDLEDLTTDDAQRIAARRAEADRQVASLPDDLARKGDELDRLDELLRRAQRGEL